MLWKVPEVPEPVDAASRLILAPLQEGVLLKELVNTHPGVGVIDLVGPLWRVSDRHQPSISLSDIGGLPYPTYWLGIQPAVLLEFAVEDHSTDQPDREEYRHTAPQRPESSRPHLR